MFRNCSEMLTQKRERLRGGNGAPEFRYLFSAQETGGRAELLAVVTLAPGESIGVHAHETNAELYYLLCGEAEVTENGAARVMRPGDAELCADGNTHSIANRTDSPAQFLAVIIPNR